MKRIAYMVGALLGGCITTSAQTTTDTTITRDIEVVKEYNPVIREAGKINTMPELKHIETKKIKPSYSVWTSSFTPKADIIPSLDYALAKDEENVRVTDHFIKFGGGNYTSFLGEVYTPIYKDSRYLFDIYGKHNSSFGNVNLTPDLYPSLPGEIESDALSNDNKIKASLLRSYRKAELSSFAGFGYKQFNYYGYDTFAENAALAGESEYKGEKQAFTNFDINVRYRTKDYVGKWKYDLQTNYLYFHNRNKLSESTIYTNLMGDYRMETSSLSANLEMYNIFMSRPGNTDIYNFENEENAKSHTILKISPNYRFEGNMGTFHIGVKGVFGIGQGRPGTIIPDIYGTIRLIEKKLYLYAGVSGDYQVNNYRQMTELNPYISPDIRIEDTYIPIDVYLGTKANIANKVNLDIFVGYKILNNPYFFVNKAKDSTGYYNTFDVVYGKDAGLFNAGLSALYNWTEKLSMNLQTKYNAWSLDKIEKPWQMPTFELDFRTSYRITDYLRMDLSYSFNGGRYACVDGKSISMDDAHDISLGANYSVLSFANIFLNLNNILSQEYQNWYGYTAHRFNIMGGISLNF